MASIVIRNLSEDTKRKFRARAAAKGLSMEEEARRLIASSVANDEKPPRKGIFEMLYEASRPGFDLQLPPDTPASYAVFDE